MCGMDCWVGGIPYIHYDVTVNSKVAGMVLLIGVKGKTLGLAWYIFHYLIGEEANLGEFSIETVLDAVLHLQFLWAFHAIALLLGSVMVYVLIVALVSWR